MIQFPLMVKLICTLRPMLLAIFVLVSTLSPLSVLALTDAEVDDPPLTNAVVYVGGCTGTLISPRIVVTAGHCIRHDPPVSGLPDGASHFFNWEEPGTWYPLFNYPSGVTITFGNDKTNPDLSVQARHYNIAGFADIMLLGLEESVPFEVAHPVKVFNRLPEGADPSEFWADKTFHMVGWGDTGAGSPTRRHRGTGTLGGYPHTSFGIVRPNQMYVKGDGGTTVLSGDSGSPVLWQDPLGTLYLVGVAQGTESGGGRYFVPWGRGGLDSAGQERPDLSAYFETQMQADLGWYSITHSISDIRDVAACYNGDVIALRQDASLWRSANWGRDSWQRIIRAPSGTQSVSCAAGLVHLLNSDRQLTYLQGTEIVYVGYPWGAARVSGTEDSTLDFPWLWALNDDKTLWLSTAGGLDSTWKRVGQPWAAKDIAATQELVIAINQDDSLWFNKDVGKDGKWLRVGEAPSGSRDVTAATVGQSDHMHLFAVNADSEVVRGDYEPGTRIPNPILAGDTHTYEDPTYAGKRLDWCLRWANACGAPAANAWCQLKGYDQTTAYAVATDIGSTSPTYVIGDARICDSDFCDGFEAITCERL